MERRKNKERDNYMVYKVHISYFDEDFCQSFLESNKGKTIQKIYIKGDGIRFGENCFNRNGSPHPFLFYVDTINVKQNLQEALNMSDITSIEDLENRIKNIEDKINSGSLFPDGMSFTKEYGLRLEGYNNTSLTINPDSLLKPSSLFDPGSNKIDTSLYDTSSSELPSGLTYTRTSGLVISSDQGPQLTIYPGNFTKNQSLFNEEGTIDTDLYQSSLPEGISYDSKNHILKVGKEDEIGGLVLNHSLAITNLDQSKEEGTENNLVLLQPNARYYQPKEED